MLFRPAWTVTRALIAPALFLLFTGRLGAALTGPTLQLDYNAETPSSNPLSHFMYFAPLVSPEKVSLSTNAGNTQSAQVISCRCRTNGATFHAVCEFNFVGDGLQRNVFGHDVVIERRQKELNSGKPLAHQLAAISVQGAGCGTIEVEGTLTNGEAAVTEMQIRFNSRSHTSPVTIDLQDMILRDGVMCYENTTVARVNSLTFRQKSDPPKMEVTLGSVKRKDAGDGVWANFVGGIKSAAANLLLPPLTVTTNGNQAMLDFGLALAQQKRTFTFPYASRLTNGPTIGL